MQKDSQAHQESSLRLNPFVFPSETDSYFILLIITVIGVSLVYFSGIFNTIPGIWKHSQAVQTRCTQVADNTVPYDPLDTIPWYRIFDRCMATDDLIRATFIIGGVLYLFFITGLIYWFMPYWKIWRAKFEPMHIDGDPEAIEYLNDLCHEAGLNTPPKYLWDPLAPETHGQLRPAV